MIEWTQLNFQTPNNNYAIELGIFNDYVIFLLSFIILKIFVYLIILDKQNKGVFFEIYDDDKLELVWTILPFIILIIILIPSLALLYHFEGTPHCSLTLKITGFQWYWNYNLTQMIVELNAIIKTSSVFRLLETNNSLVLPYLIYINVYITSIDVIHSWTIPSLAVKIDAVPGRLNQFFILSDKTGKFFGQCSEICGVNHRFIPINVEFVKLDWFLNFYLNILEHRKN